MFVALGGLLASYAGASAIASFGDELLELPAVAGPRTTIELPLPSLSEQVAALNSMVRESTSGERMRAGDTLGALFDRLGVDDPAAQAFIRSDPVARRLLQLHPGRLVEARTRNDGQLMQLRFPTPTTHKDETQTLRDGATSRVIVIERLNDDGYRASEQIVENERRIEMQSGVIESSLYAATDAAGLPDSITQQIIDIFEADIDFHLDLQRGDTFRVVYESFWLDGELVRSGRILAVEFVNAGVPHRAVWFETGPKQGAYYDFDGRTVKRAFLRSPLEFSRVSSGFSNSRFHPVNQRWQAHRGVDYAAAAGTSVRSVSEGVVEFAGWQNGYGNVVIVRHGSTYETLYAHLRGFAPAITKGAHIEQGQVIGYVGMTGWATGPHLHFEFHVNGEPNDPLRVVLPEAAPIDASLRPAFAAAMSDYRRRFLLLTPAATQMAAR